MPDNSPNASQSAGDRATWIIALCLPLAYLGMRTITMLAPLPPDLERLFSGELPLFGQAHLVYDIGAISFLVMLLYYGPAARLHRWLLLITSLLVIALLMGPLPTLLTLLLSLIDFSLAAFIRRSTDQAARRAALWAGLGWNLAVLFVFAIASEALQSQPWLPGVAAGLAWAGGWFPRLGLSYLTFTRISYLLDSAQGQIKEPPSLLSYLSALLLYPKIAAGPIERIRTLAPVLDRSPTFDEAGVVGGLRRILWGAVKKLVIADLLALYVDQVYSAPEQYGGLALIAAVGLFSVQIYADFSGYTDIALGAAQLFGLRLTENFRQPYLAHSTLEFWRRWHISLTNWLRDYLFFPLTRWLMGRVAREQRHLIEPITYLVVMAAVGLWHGWRDTYIVWGLGYGLIMSAETLIERRWPGRNTSKGGLRLAYTLLTLLIVGLMWNLFRAESLPQAGYIYLHMFRNLGDLPSLFAPWGAASMHPYVAWGLSGGFSLLILLVDWRRERQLSLPDGWPRPLRWALYVAGLVLLIASGFLSAASNQFLYFRF